MTPEERKKLEETLGNQRTRLESLYQIINANGRQVPFRLNEAQSQFLETYHTRNIILKARQLGFSTLIALMLLDIALFYPNTSCGVIAHTLPDAQSIFRNKIKFAYDNLPEAIKQTIGIKSNNLTEIEFTNGSSIKVGTSLRGQSLQYLWVSEFGKIAARTPDKADEIITGSFNTIAPGEFIFVESTAEGQEGRFKELVDVARSLANRGRQLSYNQFKFFFYPWFDEPRYEADPDLVLIEPETAKYFRQLREEHGINLTERQRAWYAEQLVTQKDLMTREFPSHADEAFQAAIEGAYYASRLAKAEKSDRIGKVPYDPRYEVETAWDLGISDSTSIIFAQDTPKGKNIIDYYEGSDMGIADYALVLRNKSQAHGYRYSRHIFPHDIAKRDLSTNETLKDFAESVGITPITVVPAGAGSLLAGIDAGRNLLDRVQIDDTKCARLLQCLQSYRREWNDKLGAWSDVPRHDWASHGADAWRYLASAPEWNTVTFNRVLPIPNLGGW